jgi:acyl-CoA thioesterase FadM
MLIKSGVVEMDAKSARIVHQFYEGRTGKLAETFEATVGLTDLETGKDRTFPDSVRTAVEAGLVVLQDT